jgi:hypothetical protein
MDSRRALAALIAVGALALPAGASADEPALALTATNKLLSFDTASPGTITRTVDISGLQPGEQIEAIDFRPLDGKLYGLGRTGQTGRLYTLNRDTGAARQVGADFAVTLRGSSFGFDFNPTVDRIRVVSDERQNFRVNPSTGAVVDSDPITAGTQPDADLSEDGVVGSAYRNNFPGATSTTLYGIDAADNELVVQNPPNNGTIVTTGSLGSIPSRASASTSRR